VFPYLCFPKQKFLENKNEDEKCFLSSCGIDESTKLGIDLKEFEKSYKKETDDTKKQKKVTEPYFLLSQIGPKIKVEVFIGMDSTALVQSHALDPIKDNFSLCVKPRYWKVEGYRPWKVPEGAESHGTFPQHFMIEGEFSKNIEMCGAVTITHGVLSFTVAEVEDQPFNLQFE
jgi:hypothetical protein